MKGDTCDLHGGAEYLHIIPKAPSGQENTHEMEFIETVSFHSSKDPLREQRKYLEENIFKSHI